jgi:hypothetical protein
VISISFSKPPRAVLTPSDIDQATGGGDAYASATSVGLSALVFGTSEECTSAHLTAALYYLHQPNVPLTMNSHRGAKRQLKMAALACNPRLARFVAIIYAQLATRVGT